MLCQGYIALFVFKPFTVGGVDKAAKIVFSLFLDGPNTCYQVRRIKEYGTTHSRN